MKTALFMMGLAVLTAWGQDDAPLTRLYDTVDQRRDAAATLTTAMLESRPGWSLVPEDKTNHLFTGDVILVNDKLAIVFGKNGPGPDIYARTAGGLKHRAMLGTGVRREDQKQDSGALKIIENTSGGVMLEASFREGDQTPLRYRLTTGEPILEIRALQSSGYLEMRSDTRYVVVPDYFGDDVVYDAQTVQSVALPAENFVLNLLEGGQAILMTVWQSRLQEVGLERGPGNVSANRIGCLKDKSIWVACLESPDIWQMGSHLKAQNCKLPYPAKWRCNLIGKVGGTESWELASGPGPGQNQGSIAAKKLIYPLDRSAATPLTAMCPTDVMRNTLGVGPCQYILACEGMAAQGDPTPNSVMSWVEKQFEQKKDRKVADDIRERLEVMVRHVGEARGRIEGYATFAGQVQKLLATKPDVSGYQAILNDLDRFIAAGLVPMANADRARQLADEVSALIGKENALTNCQRLGTELRAIGTVQDGALARCRMAVRRLKQEGRGIKSDVSSADALTQAMQRLTEQMLNSK
jgi:hypothetical protein